MHVDWNTIIPIKDHRECFSDNSLLILILASIDRLCPSRPEAGGLNQQAKRAHLSQKEKERLMIEKQDKLVILCDESVHLANSAISFKDE